MARNIEDIFGIGEDNNKSLIGKVYYESEKDYSKYKCFYIGWEFAKEDILFNEVNRRNIGIKDLDKFRKEYVEKGAVGVIYFPQVNNYKFKMPYDTVVQWTYGISNEDAEKALMEKIDIYEKHMISLHNRIKEIRTLGEEDPLFELYGLPSLPSTTNCSRR